MGKMNELSAVLDELVDCGNRMIDTAETLKAMFTNTTENTAQPSADTETKKASAAPEKKPAATEATNKKEEKQIALSDVRMVLADKARLGHTDEVRALIKKHGASKLSAVDPKEYAALLQEAEVIGNA